MITTPLQFRKRNVWLPCSLLVAGFVALIASEPALAGALQWDGPLTTIRTSLTGPVAWAIILIAMVVAGGTLIFARSDMSEFAQRIIYIVLVFCIIALPTSLLTGLFTTTANPGGAILPM